MSRADDIALWHEVNRTIISFARSRRVARRTHLANISTTPVRPMMDRLTSRHSSARLNQQRRATRSTVEPAAVQTQSPPQPTTRSTAAWSGADAAGSAHARDESGQCESACLMYHAVFIRSRCPLVNWFMHGSST